MGLDTFGGSAHQVGMPKKKAKTQLKRKPTGLTLNKSTQAEETLLKANELLEDQQIEFVIVSETDTQMQVELHDLEDEDEEDDL